MAGLVAYASSDEGEESDDALVQEDTERQNPPIEPTIQKSDSTQQAGSSASTLEPTAHQRPPEDGPRTNETEITAPTEPPDGPLLGPSLPPTHGGSTGEASSSWLVPPNDEYNDDDEKGPGRTPKSPYTTERSLIHSLTLPPAPDMSIPPSPTGSPPPGLDTLNRKLDTFLDLKRKQGTHFNARLAASMAARNPAMMDKLLRFVGIATAPGDPPPAAAAAADDSGVVGGWDGAAQYATTLPPELWDPAGFPGWAYKDGLRRAQERGQRERARRPGEAVDFVPAAGSASGSRAGSRAGTPGAAAGSAGGGGAAGATAAAPVTGKRKSRFDT